MYINIAWLTLHVNTRIQHFIFSILEYISHFIFLKKCSFSVSPYKCYDLRGNRSTDFVHVMLNGVHFTTLTVS